jgi:hypothetical protein
LLQSLIAAHSQIASFPETHFLVATGKTRRGWWSTRLGLASPELRTQLNQFLTDVGQADIKSFVPRYGISVRQYAKALVEILDALALGQGKTLWLEKTPGHLHYIDQLERHIPDARFIHLLRNGPDVIASLYQVTHENPEGWGGVYDLDQCIDRWIMDVEITQRHRSKANHTVVNYEYLVERPKAVLAQVCRFLDVSFEPEMIARRSVALEKLVRNDETWKCEVRRDIYNANGTKFEGLFDDTQKAYIRERLAAHTP